MFILSKFSDLIRVVPSKFSKPTEQALEDEINAKYANKVVHDVGLCISLYDVLDVGDGLIKHGDGSAFIKVVFRLIVFRPFVGEVLTGWISSCSEEGIRVRMDFFDDILIPKEYLFEECVFISREQAWVWKTEHELYLDTNEKIRFRVEQEIFTDVSPRGPKNANDDEHNTATQSPPYSLLASCQTYGMGLVTWWD
ncbi:RNA polymerase III subunit Rpc25-domain-containing protein [Dipodascopsis tothii]|uniref:RNA polymerase III subunit Rpc25-domain-containing protein n=1 Tax=Dipodascopsis tothii TaxID=44089 RepID=UPI0034CD10C5